ncbi:MAG: hypothetical protein ABIA75_02995 [Candidatus Neomarinimicrobiota bacterium]
MHKIDSILSGLIFLWAFVLAQPLHELPFDFSGQYGIASVNGRALWSTIWSSGLLLFDGSVVVNPRRLGPATSQRFALFSSGGLPQMPTGTDSAGVTSKVEYDRGDWGLNRLDLSLRFSDTNSSLDLNGFKRSYLGPYGEFIQPGGIIGPIQQSYRLDYGSGTVETGRRAFSLAHYFTDSGLSDTLSSGQHRELLTSGGLFLEVPQGNWSWQVHTGQTLDHRVVKNPTGTATFVRKLNQGFFHSQVELPRTTVGNIFFGLETDRTTLPDVGNYRHNLFAGIRSDRLDLRAGIANIGSVTGFDGRIKLSREFGPWQGNLELLSEIRPVATSLLGYLTRRAENWQGGSAAVQYRSSALDITAASGIEHSGGHNSLFWSSVSDTLLPDRQPAHSWFQRTAVRYRPARDWEFFTEYQHTDNSHATLGDGIADRLRFGFQGTLPPLFKGQLKLTARVDAEGWLNRNPNLYYDPFRDIVYHAPTPAAVPQDAWPVSLQVHAVVSSVRITYQVYNLSHALAPVLRNIIPDLNSEDLLIATNSPFRPLYSLIQFRVEWTFSD